MRGPLLVFALSIVSQLGLSVALAQSADPTFDTSVARSLFQEGVALAREGDYAAATDRFRRAQALHPSPSVAYNLASALVHQGEVVEALEILNGVLRDPATTPELAQAAQRQRDAIAPRVARLTVRVDGPTDDVQVQIDSHDVRAAAIGVALPIDPGAHEVLALRGGEVAARNAVVLTEGESREVQLVIPAAEAPSVAPEPPPAPAPLALATPTPAPGHVDDGVWIGIGVGTSVLAVGIVVAMSILLTTPGPAAPVSGNTVPAVLTW